MVYRVLDGRSRTSKHYAVCTLYTTSCSNINFPRSFFLRPYCNPHWRTQNRFVLGQCPLDAHLLRIIPRHECVKVTCETPHFAFLTALRTCPLRKSLIQRLFPHVKNSDQSSV
jgi:hypothetical protein